MDPGQDFRVALDVLKDTIDFWIEDLGIDIDSGFMLPEEFYQDLNGSRQFYFDVAYDMLFVEYGSEDVDDDMDLICDSVFCLYEWFRLSAVGENISFKSRR